MTASNERWVVATGNQGKLAEIEALLRGLPVRLIAQTELGIEGAEESATTFVENALAKARHVCRHAGLPAIADDSGLCVDALGGRPGVHSARFAGPGAEDAANITRLLTELEGVPNEHRSARFHCVVVLLRSDDDPAPLIATGSWEGRIARAPEGTGGFGYDPVFHVPEQGCTAAQLPPGIKNAISHRAAALAELGRQLSVGREKP